MQPLAIRNNSKLSNIPTALLPVLDAAVDFYQICFDGALAGIYLTGSVGRGNYDSRFSDLDTIGILRAGLTIDETEYGKLAETNVLRRFGPSARLKKFDFRVLSQPLSPLHQFIMATDSAPLANSPTFEPDEYIQGCISQFPAGDSRKKIAELFTPLAIDQINIAFRRHAGNPERFTRILAKNAIRLEYYLALRNPGVPYTPSTAQQLSHVHPSPIVSSSTISTLVENWIAPMCDESETKRLQTAVGTVLHHADAVLGSTPHVGTTQQTPPLEPPQATTKEIELRRAILENATRNDCPPRHLLERRMLTLFLPNSPLGVSEPKTMSSTDMWVIVNRVLPRTSRAFVELPEVEQSLDVLCDASLCKHVDYKYTLTDTGERFAQQANLVATSARFSPAMPALV